MKKIHPSFLPLFSIFVLSSLASSATPARADDSASAGFSVGWETSVCLDSAQDKCYSDPFIPRKDQTVALTENSGPSAPRGKSGLYQENRTLPNGDVATVILSIFVRKDDRALYAVSLAIKDPSGKTLCTAYGNQGGKITDGKADLNEIVGTLCRVSDSESYVVDAIVTPIGVKNPIGL